MGADGSFTADRTHKKSVVVPKEQEHRHQRDNHPPLRAQGALPLHGVRGVPFPALCVLCKEGEQRWRASMVNSSVFNSVEEGI